MKFTQLLPLAAVTAAFVVPDEQVFAEIAENPTSKSLWEKVPAAHDLLNGWAKQAKNAFDHAVEEAEVIFDTRHQAFVHGFDAEAWLENADLEGAPWEGVWTAEDDEPPHHGPPHHGPPHHGPPHHGKPPHHGPPHKKPHHPPHHGKPNKTIYELISESKYTTKLAELVANDTELVKVLNSTKANFTLFAPTDAAFAKIPEHAPKPSKEFIREVLLYHVAPGFYPAGRLLFSHTVPTLHNETLLGDKPQRLTARLGFKGVSINFYSKVVAVNIPAKNGLIHGVDSIIIPPPKELKILELLPAEFSTLLLGLGKTGLIGDLADLKTTGGKRASLKLIRKGDSLTAKLGTFFAPPNGAFKKLGPRINAFLFSRYGEKYLKALLKYHVVANQTLYSNAYYGPAKSEMRLQSEEDVGADTIPYLHFDLPTLLEDKLLAVDVTRFGPFVTIKINGFNRVVVADGVAKDGVLHAVNNVLIPPKAPHPGAQAQFWQGEEMSIEEFKERLGPYVDAEDSKFDL
jgi:uncharacterized surface protein with fasciclin (FAS1) repeats